MNPGHRNPLAPLLDILLPRECMLCGAPLGAGEQYICAGCLTRLPRTNYHRRPDNPMEQRFAGLVPYERCAGHFFYTPLSDPALIIQNFKYRHFRNLGRYMGELMGRELMATFFLSDCDVIIPVPMHRWKRARRGYNQTEMLAEGLSRVSGIPADTSLRAVRPHKTQTSLSREERLKNTAGIFRLDNPERFRGKHILLLDDVCTTGATLTSASRAILDAQPDVRLTLLTLAVTF